MALTYNTYSVQTNNNSSYSNDLIIAKNVTNSYTAFFGDDVKKTVTLINPFFYNNVYYNTIYVNSNGSIGFNSASNIINYPTKSLASNMAAFFLGWVDTNDKTANTNSIYYKEDTTLKTFTLIYDRQYFGTTIDCQVEIVLFLDDSGKAIINFGSIGNKATTSYLGFSFGTSNQSNLINTLDGYFTPLQSPVIDINNIQANYTNKQIIIQPLLLTSPTISNFSVPTKRIGGDLFTINPPTTNSSGAITYISSNLAVATIFGSTITIRGAGNSIITATQAATANYASGITTTIFQVLQLAATQVLQSTTLSNFSIPAKTFGGASFTITPPTTNGDGAITYTSSGLAVATISGSTITIVGAGNTTITATQAATANRTSISIQTIFIVSKATPTLSISLPTKRIGDAPFTITGVTSNSTGAITYTSSNLSVATMSGSGSTSTITIVGPGSSIITVNQAATANYIAKTITATLEVLQLTTITTITNFTLPTINTFGDGPITITGVTSNSNGVITYTSSNLAVATISDSQITIVGAGSTTITATQAATDNYTAGTITATLVVSKATPTLSISPLTKTFGDIPFLITGVTTNSTGAIIYTSSNLAVATIVESTITIVGPGSSIITVNQAATANYIAKTITATLEVSKAISTLSISSLPTKTYGDIPFLITGVTTNSTGAITYTSSNLAVATIVESTITIVGPGSSTITVNLAATANYTEKTITTTLVVSNATLTNPVIISNTNGLLYFMNTESTYANITNSVNNINTLKSSTKKVLFSRNNNVTIKN